MIKRASLKSVFLFIKKNRIRRKAKIYKLAFGVLVDKTIAIYLSLIGVYIFASLFIAGDFINAYYDEIIQIEDFAIVRFWVILTILPLRYIIKSFSSPGVIYSSSEYQLSMLSYTRREVWFLTVLERWLKNLAIYMLVGILIILITPISLTLVTAYISMLLLFDIIMTIPQWKLYQTRLLARVGWLCLMLIINLISVVINSPIIGMIMIGLIIIVNISLKQTLFQRINWDKVTEVSNFKLWNMWFISKASEVKVTQPKKYSIFQNTSSRRKAFNYTEKAIHHRIWALYLGKNLGLIAQVMGVLVIMLFFFLYINELLFHIGLAVTIHVYTSMLANFFNERFQVDILNVLPWNLPSYKRTFFKWVLYGGMILLVPISIFFGINGSLWAPIKLLFICSVFLFVFNVKLDKSIVLLGKEVVRFDSKEGIGFLLLIGIVFSVKYPMIALSFVFLIFYLLKRNSRSSKSKEITSHE